MMKTKIENNNKKYSLEFIELAEKFSHDEMHNIVGGTVADVPTCRCHCGFNLFQRNGKAK